MKKQIGLTLIFFFLLLGEVVSVHAEKITDKDRIEFLEDSLYRELDAMPRDSTYLYKISGLELLLMDSPRFLFYAELKEKEARRQNNIGFICESYSDRAIYYSNFDKIDSFYYWKQKMDPLALEHKMFNYYFFLCNLEVLILIEQGKIGRAIQTAKDMYNTGMTYNSEEGLVASNMSMGNALRSARKYKEAIDAYEKALSLIPADGSNWKSWKLNIFSYLYISCDLSGEYEKGLTYMDKKQELMDLMEQTKVGGKAKKPFLLDMWAELQLQKSHFYIKLNQLQNALDRLKDVKQYYPELSEARKKSYHVSVADYYEAAGNYTQALAEFESVYPYFLENNKSSKVDLIEQRARLKEHTGALDESVDLYKQLIILKDSANNAWFDSQLNELRTIYDTDHLLLQNKELELKNKHDQLRMASLLCALAVIAFVFIFVLYVRLSRVKKELEISQGQLMGERDELVKSKEILRAAKEKAEEARDLALKAERKESFFANMSHEIRTPLNAIVGFSNLLISDEETSPEERELFINTINQNCDQLLKLVNDVLDLSRMESDKMQFSFGDFNLTEIVSEVYSTHKMLVPKELDLLREVPDHSLLAHIDKGRLKQVLSNFINNAVKFTSTGYIKIGYELKDCTIALFVEDTGRGIPEEHQKKIFERFYKQNDSDQGTGLGLSICSVIAEKMGGHLELVSEVGKGSRFSILLPFDKQLNQSN